ncbi:hypothetical protein [Streptomyces sp. NPDC002845]
MFDERSFAHHSPLLSGNLEIQVKGAEPDRIALVVKHDDMKRIAYDRGSII